MCKGFFLSIRSAFAVDALGQLKSLKTGAATCHWHFCDPATPNHKSQRHGWPCAAAPASQKKKQVAAMCGRFQEAITGSQYSMAARLRGREPFHGLKK